MHRSGSGFLLTLSVSLIIALTGCLGKSSGNAGNQGVASVTLSPGESVSMDWSVEAEEGLFVKVLTASLIALVTRT